MGNWTDKPNFFDVKVFGNQAETLAQHLAKGRRIGVDGRLDWSSWEAQDGSKRSKVEVVAFQVQFLDSRGDGASDGPPPGGEPTYVKTGGSIQPNSGDFEPKPEDDIPF